MTGPLPPSSITSSLSGASRAIAAPTALEPVKPTTTTRSCWTSAEAISTDGPVSRLNSPLGTPASTMHSASIAAIPAVVGAGLRMTALPLASAGPTYSTGMFIGKFQGVIATTTPRGWRNVITRL